MAHTNQWSKQKAEMVRLRRFREEDPEAYAAALERVQKKIAEANTPYHVDGAVYLDYITGFRQWGVNFSYLLTGNAGIVWPPREAMIAQNGSTVLTEETFAEYAGVDDAGPGLYALRGSNSVFNVKPAGMPWLKQTAYGKVALWGVVHEAKDGYKGLVGYPLELLWVSLDITKLVRHYISVNYGIPVLGIQHLEDKDDSYWKAVKDYYPLATKNTCTCEGESDSD